MLQCYKEPGFQCSVVSTSLVSYSSIRSKLVVLILALRPALGCPSAARASRLLLRRRPLPSGRRLLLRVEGVGEGEGHGAAQARLFELLEPEAGQVPVALGPAAARGSAV